MREAIDGFLAFQAEKGNRPRSIANARNELHQFFARHLQWSLARITPAVGADIYARLRTEPCGRGHPLSPDSHQQYMKGARRMLGWCVDCGWLRSNPLADLKTVGRRRHGKKQLTLDELRKLWATCLTAAAQDDGAVAVLLAYALNLRTGEIVSRTVRALDNGGTVLWIDDTDLGFTPKSKRGRRALTVPAVLQPHLQRLARGKLPGALLFESPRGPHRPSWVLDQVKRYCELAGVPVVVAHSLRGSHATTALQAGMSPELVAAAMGHESPEITLRHYAAPGSAEAGLQAARILAFERT